MKQWAIASRSLVRRPGFAAAVVLILALGIGATTALFSLVNAVLWRPLPFPDADRLVTVYEASPAKDQKTSLIAPARLEDWNRMNQTFEAIGGSYRENVTDTSGADPERLNGRRVSPRFFDVYRATPLVGRVFNAQEEVAGGPGAAMISYGLWTRRYGQNRDVTSQRLLIGGRSYPIVGVLPKEFTIASIDVWMPAQTNPGLMRVREARFYSGVGRMKPGITMAQAQADLERVQRALGEQFPQTDKDWSALVRDLKEERVGDYRMALLLIFGAVAALLLIAVANIAGLMIGQLHRRERELAIRSSLGASRGQVIGTVMREVLMMTALGAGLGAAAASWGTSLIARFFTDLPRLSELHYDWRALLFASVVGLAAAFLFGVPPALNATRGSLAALLASSGRSVAGGHHRWQQTLLATQVAVTVLLLSSAGLLLRSYYNLSHVDSGFNADHTLTFHVGAAWDEDRSRIGQLQEKLVAELERTPGVEAAGMTNFFPVSSATLRYEIELEGGTGIESAGKILIGVRTVSAGYLKALQVPLLAGESCPALRFDPKAPSKVLVNRRFAQLYGHGANLVGRHLRFAQNPSNTPPDEIAGIVGDVHEDSMSAPPFPYVYGCAKAGLSWPDPEYVVRTRDDPRALALVIRKIVHDVDPNRAVFGVKTLDDIVGDSLEQPRLTTQMLTIFAAAAMLLASVGLYGLVTMLVAARTREIGVRMALGARPGQIMGSVFAGAGRLLALGAAAGLGLTLLAARLMRALVFGISAFDGFTLAGALLLLAAVSAIAAFLPARRAAAIDPIEAMRAE